ncbi:tetratricopeptide repeat protein [Rhodovulum bhavnagarense]|nr:tetratricopeptide repeat protein [Rhodovulum bhavnagarense]
MSTIRQRLGEIREMERSKGAEAAEKALIALIREVPDNRPAYTALSRVLMKQKKFDYAVRAAEKVVRLAPMEAEPLVLAGFARLRNEDREGAAVAFADALGLDGANTRAMMGAALLKMSEDSHEDALELCERAVALDPDLERAHELIVRINLKQGRKDDALAELRDLVEAGGGSSRALRLYARLMRDEGRLDEALKAAASRLGEDRKSLKRFSQLAAFSGQADLAVDEYRKLAEATDAKPADKVRLIAALIRSGALDEARTGISALPDARVLKPLKHKLSGDIAMAEGQHTAAIALYRKACKAANAQEPDADAIGADAPEEDLAKLWQKHSAQALRVALRARRSPG